MRHMCAIIAVILVASLIAAVIGAIIGGPIYGLIWGAKAIANNCNPQTNYARMGVSYRTEVAYYCKNAVCYYPGGCKIELVNITFDPQLVPITYDSDCQLFECTSSSHNLFVWGIVCVVLISVICCGALGFIKQIAEIVGSLFNCCKRQSITYIQLNGKNDRHKCDENEAFEI